MIEILGIIASIFILISFVGTNQRKIRLLNIVGSVLFVIYGILLGSISIWLLNGITIFVHIYYLMK